MQGKVLALYITKNDAQKTREMPTKIQLDEKGIIGDKFYAKDQQRAVLITAIQSYELTDKNGISLNNGALGENILIDINPYHLLPGERLKIGNTILEITQNCTLCKGLSAVNAKLPKLLKNDRGIFAKVINGPSLIKKLDTVEFFNH